MPEFVDAWDTRTGDKLAHPVPKSWFDKKSPLTKFLSRTKPSADTVKATQRDVARAEKQEG